MPETRCWYDLKCRRPFCRFRHSDLRCPQIGACRYGEDCMRANCWGRHPNGKWKEKNMRKHEKLSQRVKDMEKKWKELKIEDLKRDLEKVKKEAANLKLENHRMRRRVAEITEQSKGATRKFKEIQNKSKKEQRQQLRQQQQQRDQERVRKESTMASKKTQVAQKPIPKHKEEDSRTPAKIEKEKKQKDPESQGKKQKHPQSQEERRDNRDSADEEQKKVLKKKLFITPHRPNDQLERSNRSMEKKLSPYTEEWYEEMTEEKETMDQWFQENPDEKINEYKRQDCNNKTITVGPWMAGFIVTEKERSETSHPDVEKKEK